MAAKAKAGSGKDGGAIQGQELRSIVDRIVALEEEKAGIAADIKEFYQAAKEKGYSTKALKVVVKREMEDFDAREQREATERAVELMQAALGDFVSSPLGEAAVRGTRERGEARASA